MTSRQQVIHGPCSAEYRNVHGVKPVDVTELDTFLRDARILSEGVFKHIYGNNLYRRYAQDNSVVVSSIFKEPVVKEYVKPRAISHKNGPRKNDYVKFISNEEPAYGQLRWVSFVDDVVGIVNLKTKEFDTWPMDVLESTDQDERSVRWRIYL